MVMMMMVIDDVPTDDDDDDDDDDDQNTYDNVVNDFVGKMSRTLYENSDLALSFFVVMMLMIQLW